jgi:hypothetical protein
MEIAQSASTKAGLRARVHIGVSLIPGFLILDLVGFQIDTPPPLSHAELATPESVSMEAAAWKNPVTPELGRCKETFDTFILVTAKA